MYGERLPAIEFVAGAMMFRNAFIQLSFIAAINRILSLLDVRISRASISTRWQMASVVYRVAGVCPDVASIIDVGAASGSWAAIAHEAFPSSSLLAVEPLSESYVALQKLLNHIPQSYSIQAVISDTDNAKIDFSIAADRDGSGVGIATGVTQAMTTRTLDSVVSELRLEPPFLIKLDTHGHELPILNGARDTLRNSSAVIIEAYNFQISDQSPYFWELINVMYALGFRPFDLADPSPRPRDHALWQFDLVFLPLDHPAFLSNQYATA